MEKKEGIMKLSNPKNEDHFAHLRKADKHVMFKHKDTILANTHKPVILTESGKFLYDSVYYVHKEDVHVRMVSNREKTTYCPIKGEASYWHWDELEDVAWSYELPLEQAKMLKNYIAFDLEKVDLFLLSD
jgi:uncharacterized protein (DUF427 family)